MSDDLEYAHLKNVFESSKTILAGIISGPMFSVSLVNAMQASTRTTLGSILVDEAWDMAETLVSKYEEKLSSEAANKSI